MSEVKSWKGGTVGTETLDASGLGEAIKTRLLATVIRMYEANQRQGTVRTKTRAETAYTENKPFRQKGTGNARRGDRNSPLLRGGGVIHGPKPRDYSYSIPRKALREALRSALVGKLRDSEVCVLHGDAFGAPSTKTAAGALKALECSGSAVIVLPGDNEAIHQSFRNIPRVTIVRAADLNAHHALFHRHVVLVDDAWSVLMERLATFKRKGAVSTASAAPAAETPAVATTGAA